MSYNNFSDWYKKALINSETKIKEIWFKELWVEDVFIEIVKNSTGGIKEIFSLYGINEKLTLEIINKGLFNENPENRKWVYSGMNARLKNIILWSVKVAASYSKQRASIEDFLLSMIKNDSWLISFFDYIGITATDIEKNLNDLNTLWAVDGVSQNPGFNPNEKPSEQENNSNIWIEPTGDEAIDQLLGALTQNLIGWDGQNQNPQMATPFDANKKQDKKKDDSTTPALDFFSTDLTAEAREGKIEKVLGRETQIERLIAILNRKTKNNPALVGEPGVGKTAIAEWLALRIIEGNVPFSMKDKRILSLDMSTLIAGTKYRGEFESRIKQVIDEASKVENEIVLFIDEIHTIIWAWGWEWTLDASNILKPAMGRWKIRVIWATTHNEYQKYIEKDSALERRFQKITVDEPNKEISMQIISGIKDSFEEYHNLNISEDAVKAAVELSIRYITDRYLPDKAIDLIDEACSIKSMKYNFDETATKKLKEKIASVSKNIEQAVIAQSYKKATKLKQQQAELEQQIQDLKQKFTIPKEERLEVTQQDVQKVLHISTGIPISNLNKDEITRIKNLSREMKKHIIGQDEAVDNITKSIMRSKTGISNPNRPLGSFLFLWPTGVGKTELVKVLAQQFYDDKDALIKFDMSEFSDKTSVNKLIWSSAGYVWYEEGGMLTEKVRKKPYSVVLFDEIEKWDFEVYNLLLQILEDWVLTDNKWRKINFKNTVIIMTSNIWQEEFMEKANSIGFDVTDDKEEDILEDYKRASEKIKENLTDYFSPEFVNRIDKTIVFNPLDKAAIKKIVKLQLEIFSKRLEAMSYTFSYDNKTINFIAKTVYNPDFWAREIRRYITDNIEDLIAEKVIWNANKKDFSVTIEKNTLIIS